MNTDSRSIQTGYEVTGSKSGIVLLTFPNWVARVPIPYLSLFLSFLFSSSSPSIITHDNRKHTKRQIYSLLVLTLLTDYLLYF